MDSSMPSRNLNARMTSEEMINKSSEWTLGCDSALLNRLKDFSNSVVSQAEGISKDCDSLSNEVNLLQSRVESVTNEFLMLANTQYVENRVEEFEERNPNPTGIANKSLENPVKTKAEKEAELMARMKEAIQIGLRTNSDQHSREEAKIKRSHLIGTPKFFSSRYCGLVDENKPILSSISSDQLNFLENSTTSIVQPPPTLQITQPSFGTATNQEYSQGVGSSSMAFRREGSMSSDDLSFGKVPVSNSFSSSGTDVHPAASHVPPEPAQSKVNNSSNLVDDLNKVLRSRVPPPAEVGSDDSEDDFRPQASGQGRKLFDEPEEEEDDFFGSSTMYPTNRYIDNDDDDFFDPPPKPTLSNTRISNSSSNETAPKISSPNRDNRENDEVLLPDQKPKHLDQNDVASSTTAAARISQGNPTLDFSAVINQIKSGPGFVNKHAPMKSTVATPPSNPIAVVTPATDSPGRPNLTLDQPTRPELSQVVPPPPGNLKVPAKESRNLQKAPDPTEPVSRHLSNRQREYSKQKVKQSIFDDSDSDDIFSSASSSSSKLKDEKSRNKDSLFSASNRSLSSAGGGSSLFGDEQEDGHREREYKRSSNESLPNDRPIAGATFGNTNKDTSNQKITKTKVKSSIFAESDSDDDLFSTRRSKVITGKSSFPQTVNKKPIKPIQKSNSGLFSDDEMDANGGDIFGNDSTKNHNKPNIINSTGTRNHENQTAQDTKNSGLTNHTIEIDTNSKVLSEPVLDPKSSVPVPTATPAIRSQHAKLANASPGYSAVINQLKSGPGLKNRIPSGESTEPDPLAVATGATSNPIVRPSPKTNTNQTANIPKSQPLEYIVKTETAKIRSETHNSQEGPDPTSIVKRPPENLKPETQKTKAKASIFDDSDSDDIFASASVGSSSSKPKNGKSETKDSLFTPSAKTHSTAGGRRSLFGDEPEDNFVGIGQNHQPKVDSKQHEQKETFPNVISASSNVPQSESEHTTQKTKSRSLFDDEVEDSFGDLGQNHKPKVDSKQNEPKDASANVIDASSKVPQPESNMQKAKSRSLFDYEVEDNFGEIGQNHQPQVDSKANEPKATTNIVSESSNAPKSESEQQTQKTKSRSLFDDEVEDGFGDLGQNHQPKVDSKSSEPKATTTNTISASTKVLQTEPTTQKTRSRSLFDDDVEDNFGEIGQNHQPKVDSKPGDQKETSASTISTSSKVPQVEPNAQRTKNRSLFDDESEYDFGDLGQKNEPKVDFKPNEAKTSITNFISASSKVPQAELKTTKIQKTKSKVKSIFDESESDDDLFSSGHTKSKSSATKPQNLTFQSEKPSKSISKVVPNLFSDDDLFDTNKKKVANSVQKYSSQDPLEAKADLPTSPSGDGKALPVPAVSPTLTSVKQMGLNLKINPLALKPGSKPPTPTAHEIPCSFDEPPAIASENLLTGVVKTRAKIKKPRRLPSRKQKSEDNEDPIFGSSPQSQSQSSSFDDIDTPLQNGIDMSSSE